MPSDSDYKVTSSSDICDLLGYCKYSKDIECISVKNLETTSIFVVSCVANIRFVNVGSHTRDY